MSDIPKYTIEIYAIDVVNGKFQRLDIISNGYSNLRYMNRLNGVGSATFSLNINNPHAVMSNLVRFRNQILIKRNGTPVFLGVLSKVGGNLKNVEGYLELEASGYLYHFDTRFTSTNEVYVAAEQSNLMNTLIQSAQNRTNGNLLISQGATTTASNISTVYNYRNIKDEIINISKVDAGIYFTFDPVLDNNGIMTGVKFNCYKNMGNVRNDLPTLHTGSNSNILSLDFVTNANLVNSGIGIGAGYGDNILTVSQDVFDSGAFYTRREIVDSYKDENVLGRLTQQLGYRMNKYSTENFDINITIKPYTRPFIGEFGLADYLNLNIQVGNLSFVNQSKVIEIDVEVDNNGVELVTPRFAIV